MPTPRPKPNWRQYGAQKQPWQPWILPANINNCRPQHSTLPRYSGHSSHTSPPHRQLVFPWGPATQHPDWRKVVGDVCFWWILDAVDVRQCVLQFCVRVYSASINKIVHLLHIRYKNALIEKMQQNPFNDILPSNYTNLLPASFCVVCLKWGLNWMALRCQWGGIWKFDKCWRKGVPERFKWKPYSFSATNQVLITSLWNK